jgi:hypothetical protein
MSSRRKRNASQTVSSVNQESSNLMKSDDVDEVQCSFEDPAKKSESLASSSMPARSTGSI